MERIARNSWGKLLAFVMAFALAFVSFIALLPLTASARTSSLDSVDIYMTLPTVGAKASTVADGIISFEIYDEDGASVEIEDIDEVEITAWEYDETQTDYVEMTSDDVFDVDGIYAITISLSDDDTAKMVGDPYVCFNGLDKYCEYGLSYWDGMYTDMFILEEIEFCTITFDSAGGSEVEPINVIWGGYAYKPQEPTREGYVFYDWLDEDGHYFDWYEPIDDDYNLTALWAPLHGVISGDNQTFYLESGDDIVIRFDANYNDFSRIGIFYAENEDMVDISKGGYLITEGSTVVTLSNALLKTMDPGAYEVWLEFEDSDYNVSYAYATLNIAEGAAPSTSPSTSPATPQTGDNSNVIALAGIAGAAAVGLTVIVAYRKKVTE